MPMEQYATLVRLMPHIETVLREKGETVPRPHYESIGQGHEEGSGEEGGGEESEGGADGKGLRGGVGGDVDEKKNFEATSEEDDG